MPGVRIARGDSGRPSLTICGSPGDDVGPLGGSPLLQVSPRPLSSALRSPAAIYLLCILVLLPPRFRRRSRPHEDSLLFRHLRPTSARAQAEGETGCGGIFFEDFGGGSIELMIAMIIIVCMSVSSFCLSCSVTQCMLLRKIQVFQVIHCTLWIVHRAEIVIFVMSYQI